MSEFNEVVQQIMANQRSPHLRRQFFSVPPSEYTTSRELRVWVGSFNTNGAMPSASTDVHSWIHHAGAGLKGRGMQCEGLATQGVVREAAR